MADTFMIWRDQIKHPDLIRTRSPVQIHPDRPSFARSDSVQPITDFPVHRADRRNPQAGATPKVPPLPWQGSGRVSCAHDLTSNVSVW
jgi:hypothetical protein